ncbi:MAG TPA: hypothetical protein VGF36_05590, partial [Rhodopila sp.]
TAASIRLLIDARAANRTGPTAPIAVFVPKSPECRRFIPIAEEMIAGSRFMHRLSAINRIIGYPPFDAHGAYSRRQSRRAFFCSTHITSALLGRQYSEV